MAKEHVQSLKVSPIKCRHCLTALALLPAMLSPSLLGSWGDIYTAYWFFLGYPPQRGALKRGVQTSCQLLPPSTWVTLKNPPQLRTKNEKKKKELADGLLA